MQAEIFGFAKENEHFRYIFKGNHITKKISDFCWGGGGPPGTNADFQLMLRKNMSKWSYAFWSKIETVLDFGHKL